MISLFPCLDFWKVYPIGYGLFQIADGICVGGRLALKADRTSFPDFLTDFLHEIFERVKAIIKNVLFFGKGLE